MRFGFTTWCNQCIKNKYDCQRIEGIFSVKVNFVVTEKVDGYRSFLLHFLAIRSLIHSFHLLVIIGPVRGSPNPLMTKRKYAAHQNTNALLFPHLKSMGIPILLTTYFDIVIDILFVILRYEYVWRYQESTQLVMCRDKVHAI